MDCPRCGGSIEVYRLGDEESGICADCRYVGIPTEHRAEATETESWDVAFARFREAVGGSGPDGRAAGAADPVEALEVPGEDAVRERRKAAVRDLYATLRAKREASRSELLAALAVTDHGYESAESFWANAGREVLRGLPGVVAPGAGEHAWRFRPENG